MLKFLSKYREAGLLLLRVSIGLIFVVVCGPVLFEGHRRWAQFGSAMHVFNFHAHLDWWGFVGVLFGFIGGILMTIGVAFRLGVFFAFLVALVNAIAVTRHEQFFYAAVVPVEAVIILVCLAFLGPGQYSVDKS